MRFGLEFVPGDLYWKTVYYAIQAEKGGFDYLWITDHFTNRNVYISLAIILNYTDRIIVGTGVTNPYLINPLVTAGSIVTLNEVAPKRVICGIGAGDKTTLEQAGIAFNKPLTTMKEAVKIIRSITRGEQINFKGKIFEIPGGRLNFRAKNPVPIYVGAQGPKMLALAGEIGDGVLINASHPSDLKRAIIHIDEGLNKIGKLKHEIDIAAYTSFSIHENYEQAVKAAIPVVAFIVAGCPTRILETHGINSNSALEIRNSLVRGKFGNAFAKVSKQMIDTFSVSGTPDMCIEKIATIAKTGVQQFVAGSPIGPNVRASINLFTSQIMPHFEVKQICL
jgi:5,10-methylenetetrahydromethanopterin reductase